MITRDEALNLLWYNPIEVGHWVGLTDLTDINNQWLHDFLFVKEDQTLQAHRGSFKTTTLSLFFALHTVTDPNETLLFFRKTGTDVNEVLRQTSNILHSGCMQAIVRAIYNKDFYLPVDTNSQITTNLMTSVKGSSQIVGLGIGTSITGKHADVVVTDDIVNVKDRTSQAERERTKRAYMELQNIKNRGGRIINTGTPWHKDDAFTLMPNPKKWTWKDTGLISEEEAEDIKAHMTNSLFAANYELRHIAEDDVIFDNPKTGADPSLVEQGTSHTDAAYWGSDTTAFTIVKRHGDTFYVFGKVWEKHVDNCMDMIEMYHDQFKCGKMYNELNADKGYLAKQFRLRGIKVVNYTENENKYIKITSYLKFEWKNVVFVEGTDEKYIQQITDFNENADHDDCADSLSSLIRVLGGKKKNATDYKPLWN